IPLIVFSLNMSFLYSNQRPKMQLSENQRVKFWHRKNYCQIDNGFAELLIFDHYVFIAKHAVNGGKANVELFCSELHIVVVLFQVSLHYPQVVLAKGELLIDKFRVGIVFAEGDIIRFD